jgi:hypothetical protein
MYCSVNKTDRHDITEILLKVALNIITLSLSLSLSLSLNNIIKNKFVERAKVGHRSL